MVMDILFPDGVPADLREYGLVMPQAVRDSLIAKQDAANITLHRVQPVALINGQWALNADVLSEAHPNGLFNRVELLDAGNVAQVVTMPWSDVLALLPQSDPDDLPAPDPDALP